MTQTPFFPGPIFGWTFYLTLVTITLLASYVDWKRLQIPKALTLTALALGVVFSAVRGAWLGSQGQAVWLFAAPGAGLGAVDGLLFALAGFATGFGLFFALWVLGTCGGGDVKLMAALGAWIGPLGALYVLIGSYAVVVITVAATRTFGALLQGNAFRKAKQKLAYSFPVALSTAVILLWVFRAELLPQVPEAPAARVSQVGR
jgi:prepilin peptidase CpaA